MMQKIDLTKLLKPGDKVFSIISGKDVRIQNIDFNADFPIVIGNGLTRPYNRFGSIFKDGSDCLLWPDKNTDSWEGYCSFKRGDVVLVYNDNNISCKRIGLFSHSEDDKFFIYSSFENGTILCESFTCCEYPNIEELNYRHRKDYIPTNGKVESKKNSK